MPLDPDKVYREIDAKELFGIGLKHLKTKIKSGDIPEPQLLLPPPSRARGWLGADLIAWRTKVAASQAEWNAENAKHQPKGGDVKKTNPPKKPEAVAKRRLRPRKARKVRS